MNKKIVTIFLALAVGCSLHAQERGRQEQHVLMEEYKKANDFGTPEFMRCVNEAEKAQAVGNWDLAAECYRMAMRSDPANPQNVLLLSNVGMMQFYSGRDSLALITLSEARAMAPKSKVILRNRARVLTTMGRTDDALRDFEILEKMDSTYAEMYSDRAAIRMAQLKVASPLMRDSIAALAEADIDRFRSLKPDDLQGTLLKAVFLSNMQRPEEALPLYSQLIEKQPEAEYYAARAMCYLIKEDLAAASDDIARGLELDGEDPELYYCRAVLNKLRYRDEDAAADLKLALRYGLSPARAASLVSPN